MKLSILAVLISLLLSQTASTQVTYSTYTNKRFFYSIDYPSSLVKMQAAPANDDGRVFLSNAGDVELRVWGEHNSLSQTLEQRYMADLDQFGSGVSYRRLLDTGFVISGIRNGKIYYQKTLYHRDKETEVFYTFIFEYPQTRRRSYDPIVRRIAASFRFDPDANV